MFWTARSGRRIPMMALFALAGFCLIIVVSLHSSSSSSTSFSAVMVLLFFGKLGISGTYGLSVLFVTELFPTNARSKALGVCSIGARMGSIWSPYAVVSELVITMWTGSTIP